MASHFRFLTWLGLCLTTLSAADLKPADLEFFESKIRPVLVAECYECHDAKKQKGDLRLDYRDGLLKGGEEGPAIVPGDAKKSLCHGEIGKGLNDYDAIFTELKRVGFDGWISIEDGVDGIDQLRRSADFLKRKTAQYWG